ncbi:MAG: D-alanyl-D-alanine carboxypeptidase [Coriobacteriia bacterium]|nr:D-alanyl-D-alanine carboxypeptidase [Coriobacteriia bacterium]
MRPRPHAFFRIILSLAIVAGVWGLPGSKTAADPPRSQGSQAYAYSLPSDLIGGTPLSEHPEVTDSPSIEAPCGLVATADGLILWERGGDIQMPMASTTKIMTAVVALETTNLNQECLVSWGAASTGGSSAYLQAGDRLSMHDLLICLLLPSGNDAATAIAENVAGTVFDFVDMMNAKAAELGMTHTHYVDACGLEEEGLHSTVQDYLILARYAMRNTTFREIVGSAEATVDITGRQTTYYNLNKLFGMMDGVLGIKTGTNYEADACLVACVRHNEIVYYSVIFGSPTDETRYQDTIRLLEWAFKHYKTVQLIDSSTIVGDMALTDWLDVTVSVRAPRSISLDVFDISGPITQEVQLENWEGAVIQGQKVGRIIWTQDGEVLATSDLEADLTVEAPGFWDRFQISWDRFWGGFSGKPKHAETTINLPEVLEISSLSVIM